MKLSADRTQLVVNPSLTLADIPPEIFDYRLGNRSALEWVVDQQRVKTDRRSGIVSDPNDAEDPERIVRLVKQVVSVSVGLVVAELELECDGDDDSAGAAACAEFEAPPAFVQLPLTTGAVDVASAPIPNGTYTELEFEVEDLEADHGSEAERKQVADLLASIRATYGDFPDEASMVVEGSFTPAGSTTAAPFRAYFDAEIEVKMGLQPPLTISESGASRALVVDVQPALWFRRANGTVLDLSQLDFAKTGRLIEFELEMGKGFSKVDLD
jgi:hypothetical protein